MSDDLFFFSGMVIVIGSHSCSTYLSVWLVRKEESEGGSSGWEEVGGMNDANVRELAAACRSKFGWLVRAIQ